MTKSQNDNIHEMAIVLADGTVTDAPLHNEILGNPEAEKLADELAVSIAEGLGCPEIAELIRESS